MQLHQATSNCNRQLHESAALEVQAAAALDPGPDFPPLVATLNTDDRAGAYAGGGGLEDDIDDIEGHNEHGMSDGEDEEMIMLHVRSSPTLWRRVHAQQQGLDAGQGQTAACFLRCTLGEAEGLR